MVFTSALVQGLTINPLANKLGLNATNKKESTFNLELTSIGKANADIIELTLDSESKVLGKSIKDLRLPKDCLINVIVRNNKIVPPNGETILKQEDVLFVLCYLDQVGEVKKVFYG